MTSPRELQPAIHAQAHAAAESCLQQSAVRITQTDFPGEAGVLDGSERRSAGAAVVAADGDHVGAGLGYSGRDDAHARSRNQLHANARARVHGAQVVDQLRQVFNAVDVVVRRRRDQRHAGHGMPQPRDVCSHFLRRQLPAFAGFGALRHLDLDLVGVHQIFGGNAKAPGSHLLHAIVGFGMMAVEVRIFPTLAGIGASAEPVHGRSQRAVRLGRNRPQRHRLGAEAAQECRPRSPLRGWRWGCRA